MYSIAPVAILALPTIPIPPLVSSFFSLFPLKTYPSPTTSSAPSVPTLWLLGPPSPLSSGDEESLDPKCRQAQAWARFAGRAVAVRWRASPAGAPGAVLPALHLSNGELLDAADVGRWITSPDKFYASPNGGTGTGSGGSRPSTASEEEKEPGYQAYQSLVNTTLLPAVLAVLYLSPTPLAHPVVPATPLPILSAWAAYAASLGDRQARIEEVKKLRGKKTGLRAVLDLEEVEREGVETIGSLEAKLKAEGGEQGWLGGATNPTQLDALVYALLSIVLLLPSSTDAPLKEKLERCPTLLAWLNHRKP